MIQHTLKMYKMITIKAWREDIAQLIETYGYSKRVCTAYWNEF